MERKVWPIWAWISGVLVAISLTLGWVTVFVDHRWEGFTIAFVCLGIWAGSGTVGMAISEVTYEKKPRGWRKERRWAEKEAYVRQLERELGIK